MVKRVYGRVDGLEVVMTNNGNRWEVPVPLDEDGEYIVEVIAEDEAGNTTYVTKMLFVLSGSKISSYLLPLPYTTEVLKNDISNGVKVSPYVSSLLEKPYYVDLLGSTYIASLEGGTTSV